MKNPLNIIKENPKKSLGVGAGIGAVGGLMYAKDSIVNGLTPGIDAVSGAAEGTKSLVDGVLNSTGAYPYADALAPFALPLYGAGYTNMLMKKVLGGEKNKPWLRYGANLLGAGAGLAIATTSYAPAVMALASVPLLYKEVLQIPKLLKGAGKYGIKKPVYGVAGGIKEAINSFKSA